MPRAPPAGPRDDKMSVVPIQGSERFRARTRSQAPSTIPQIPGNLGASFFATLDRQTRGCDDADSGRAVTFRTARRNRQNDVVELDARLLQGVQSRWEALGTPRKLKQIKHDFKELASGGGSGRARPQTPRELREQARRAQALARIKEAGGRGPACGRRSDHEVQHLLQTSMQVDLRLADPNRRPQWITPRGAHTHEQKFPFGPPVRDQPEQSARVADSAEPSDEQKKADELRALAGLMTSEQKQAALLKRQEEIKFRVLTPDDWRCSTSKATRTKPERWQWTGVAGALAQEDPVAIRPNEDPRWSERDLSLVEICDGSVLDPDVIRSIASAAVPAQWSCPDANGRTALHAVCQNPALHFQALEAILDHAPFEAWRARCGSEHGSTPLHLICANQTAFDSEILGLVVGRAAASLPLRSRSAAISALWTLADDTGCLPLHALCGNTLGVSSNGAAIKPIDASDASQYDTPARAEGEIKLMRAQVAHELEAEVAFEMHIPAQDRENMNMVDREVVVNIISLAMAKKDSVPRAIATALEQLRASQPTHKALDKQGAPISLLSTPGEHANARTPLKCAEQLNAALTLALSSAPKACWYHVDQAGRQPTHHLLENPIRHSCKLGMKIVAGLERRLAALDAQSASFNVPSIA